MKKHYISLLLSVTLIAVTLPHVSANVVADREITVENNIQESVKTDNIEDKINGNDVEKIPMTAKLEGKTITYDSVKTEKSIDRENEQKEQEIKTSNIIASRGGTVMDFTRVKRVEFVTSVYTNSNSRMEGGQYDKQGKRLTSHDMPIVALPKDIPYGSIVIFDEAILGDTCYTNVDDGGRIIWLNKEKTKCKVDIFMPNATQKEMLKYDNKTVYGWLYYK
jgi:predicted RND superfamily exporter protein